MRYLELHILQFLDHSSIISCAFNLTVTCEVSEWSDFGNCSALCDGGVQNRTRKIVVDSGDCDRLNLTETVPCNEEPCGM